MSENINNVVTENEKEISASSILREITNIQKDNSHIFDALKQLEHVKSECSRDIGAEEKAKAIADVVKCRETTNQRLIDFYERAYFDCIAEKKADRTEKINMIKDILISYLNQSAQDFEGDMLFDIKEFVQSQLNLLIMDIQADKI